MWAGIHAFLKSASSFTGVGCGWVPAELTRCFIFRFHHVRKGSQTRHLLLAVQEKNLTQKKWPCPSALTLKPHTWVCFCMPSTPQSHCRFGAQDECLWVSETVCKHFKKMSEFLEVFFLSWMVEIITVFSQPYAVEALLPDTSTLG